MKGGGEIQDQGGTDGQNQKLVRYYEDGQSPEYTNKGVVRSGERDG